MAAKPYLIFSLHDTRYAIAAEQIVEIFLLPELIPIAESPPDILGLLDFHSLYIPVMHLDLRLGRQLDWCHLTDSVIVVDSSGFQVGVIVHQVETVINIDDRYIQRNLDYGREHKIDRAFLQGIVNLDDEMIILLDADNLIRHPQAMENLAHHDDLTLDTENPSRDFYESYFPAATDKTKELLYDRSANLKVASQSRASVDFVSIAVVKLNGDYFAIDLDLVREFTTVGRIATVPCCPNYVIGNMNLRGEILTLIDVCQPLNLTTKNRRPKTKAIVAEIDGIIAGIVVEEVVDIIEFRPEELKPVPVATDINTSQYLKGIVDFFDMSFNIIDLPKLITQGAVTVELAA
ncbi:MAG: chemotaxis protein CheW [Cyanobacteria bacterium P01_G01_bin.19]